MKKYGQKTFAFKAKPAGKGTFSGYASVFGVVDSYSEAVMPGAFADSLKARKESGRPVPALWQHRSGEPIGKFPTLDEDDRGLKVTDAILLIDSVARASEAYALLEADVLGGMSIGYYVEDAFYNEKAGVLQLRKLDLVEISLVTFPANVEATVDSVKSAAFADMIRKGTLPTPREVEEFLRESGFSKTQAAAIIGKGYTQLYRGEPEGKAEQAAVDAILNFKLPQF